jgi:uncharacterized protein (DUF1778 family)
MPTNRTLAVRKYNAKTYERVSFRVKKGQQQEIINAAKEAGLSTNAFIVAAIEEKMARDKGR